MQSVFCSFFLHNGCYVDLFQMLLQWRQQLYMPFRYLQYRIGWQPLQLQQP